jgi:hypothetical protein
MKFMAKNSFIKEAGPAEALCDVLTDLTRVSKAVSVKWNTEYRTNPSLQGVTK